MNDTHPRGHLIFKCPRPIASAVTWARFAATQAEIDQAIADSDGSSLIFVPLSNPLVLADALKYVFYDMSAFPNSDIFSLKPGALRDFIDRQRSIATPSNWPITMPSE